MKTQQKINLNFLILGSLVLGTGVFAHKEKQPEVKAPGLIVHATTEASVAPLKAQAVPAKPQPTLEPIELELQAYMKLEEGGAKDLSKLAMKREKMLKNAWIMRNLRIFLSRTPSDAREAAEQNAGFALLLEGAHGNQSEAATQALRMVVADKEMDEILAEGDEGVGRRVQSEDEEVVGLRPHALQGSLETSASFAH